MLRPYKRNKKKWLLSFSLPVLYPECADKSEEPACGRRYVFLSELGLSCSYICVVIVIIRF